MICRKFEHWAGLYVEGDLGDRASRGLEKHMASCSRCRELVQGLRESQEGIKEWSKADLSPEAFVEMRRRARKTVKAEADTLLRGNAVSGAWWKFALAGGLTLLLIGVLFVSDEQSPLDESGPTAEENSAPVDEVLAKPELRVPERESHLVPKPVTPEVVVSVVDEPQMMDAQFEETETAPIVMAEEAGNESPAEDLVVKLVTDDPDIVIYWLVEANGG